MYYPKPTLAALMLLGIVSTMSSTARDLGQWEGVPDPSMSASLNTAMFSPLSSLTNPTALLMRLRYKITHCMMVPSLREDENRLDLIREAIEKELKRRKA